MVTDCEKVLTENQKQLLDHRRRAASEARKLRGSPAAGDEVKN